MELANSIHREREKEREREAVKVMALGLGEGWAGKLRGWNAGRKS